MAQPLFSPSRTRRYRGGCSCGSVIYEVMLDLVGTCPNAPSVWERRAQTLSLLCGEDALSGYQFSEAGVHHFFCEHCGTRAYSQFRFDDIQFYTLDLKCLHVTAALADVTAYSSVS